MFFFASGHPLKRGLATAVLGFMASSAFAQSSSLASSLVNAPSADEPGVGEIIVTATRRNQSLQSVPLSISAVTSETLEKTAANTFFDYATKIPNLSFSVTNATGGRSVAIRGIADAGTTSFYIDDTPVSDGLDPKVVDVARIEVLRGPQGTLYGGRSEGGTVRLITQQPDASKIEGRVHASLATTAHTDRPNYQFDGAINIPIVADKIAVRVAGLHQDEAGYFKRAIGAYAADPTAIVKNVGEARTDGVSITAVIKPDAAFSITPRLLYQRTKTNGLPYGDVPLSSATAPLILEADNLVQRRQTDVKESGLDRWLLGTLDLKYQAGFGTFVSASSYFHRLLTQYEDNTDFIQDIFGIPGISTPEQSRLTTDGLTQELRFSSAFSGRFQIVAGLYYDRQKSDGNFPDLVAPGLNDLLGGALGGDNLFSYRATTIQTEAAAYTEATYKITDKFSLIGGLRYFRTQTRSGKQYEDGFLFGGPAIIPAARQKENGFTPKASLQYRFSRDVQIYATAAKGFRPGGNNIPIPAGIGCDAELAALGVTSADTGQYKSDSVWSYEVGAKTSMLNRRLTANASAFNIDWNKIQQSVTLQCGFGFRTNAGAARSRGVEIELNASPAAGLNIGGGFGYTDAEFTKTASGAKYIKGDRVSGVPRYTANVDASYRFILTPSLDMILYGDYKYVGSSVSSLNAPIDPATGRPVAHIRPSYSIVDMRAALEYGNYELALFAKNLTDKRASLGDPFPLGFSNSVRDRVSVNQPRTIGIEGRARF